MSTDPIQRLKALSASPYDPEPPRRSRVVDVAMFLGHRRSSGACITPHLHGGTTAEKAEYEYNTAPSFWDGFRVTTAVLDRLDVIDVGCGWGGKAIYHAEHSALNSITGFDLPGVFDAAAATEFARQRGLRNCTFTTGYAENIPAPDDSFDVALMDDVLEHVADPERAIEQCRRVLRPGGLLLIKFPSIRMMQAHHLDRALTYPGLHYVASFKRWAAGLNDLRLRDEKWDFEPFDEVVTTRYHPAVTRNLNGLDLGGFRRLVERSGFHVRQLDLAPLDASHTSRRRIPAMAYRALWSLPQLREVLGNRIVFAGQKA